MNRLVLVPCVLVIAFYVAFASYLAWPTIVYQHGRSRAALDAPTSVANHGEMQKDGGSPTEQMSPALAANEAPTKLAAQTTKSVPAALPESHELTWVTVLLPARVHAGPSIKLQLFNFIQLEHRFMPRAIGTIGLKLTSPIPRNPGGSIENI